MKKTLILLLFVTTVALGQKRRGGGRDNMIYFSGGAAISVGSFADASGGCASNGFAGDLLYQHKQSNRKTRGFAVGIRYQNSPFDKTKAAAVFPGQINSATSWNATTILFGRIWELKMSEKAFFEPRILIGVMFANTPSIDTSSGSIQSASGAAFATQLGFKFRFDLSDNVSLLVGTDYNSATPKFTNNVGGTSVSASQSISTINLMGGIGYRF